METYHSFSLTPKALLLNWTAHAFFPKDQFIAQNRDVYILAPRLNSQLIEHTWTPNTHVSVPGL